MTEDETLNRLATRLHEANAALASQDNREDQRLIEVAQGAAERIEARAVEAEAAYAEFEAYGVRKAQEGAVKVGVSEDGNIADTDADVASVRYVTEDGVWTVPIQATQSPNPYTNGHDGPSTEE